MTPISRRRPSFGRRAHVRGLDLFDTPPIALGPLFAHEPLLAGVTSRMRAVLRHGQLGRRDARPRAHRPRQRHPRPRLSQFHRARLHRDDRAAGGLRRAGEQLPLYGRHEPHRTRAGARLSRDRAVAQAAVPVDRRALRAHAQARSPAARPRPGGAAAGHARRGPPRQPAARRGARTRCTPGSCSIGTIAGRRRSTRCRSIGPTRACPGRIIHASDNGYHPPPRGTSRAYVLARLRRDGREDLAGLVEARTLSVRGALRHLQAGDGQLRAEDHERRRRTATANRARS